MEEKNQNEGGGLMATTPEAVKQRMNISLTKVSLSIQSLQNEADALVLNEDEENLEKAKKFLEKTAAAKKEIVKTHKDGKDPYWKACQAWDTGKKDLEKAVTNIDGPVAAKYAQLCESIAAKQRDAARKETEKERINKLIESTGIDFSTKIANCETRTQLNDIERLINLEKSPSRSSKYGEFHEKAIQHFDELLIPVLKDQKKRIEEREELEKQLQATNDPEKYDEVAGKLAQKENEIIQNRVIVQENAMIAPVIEETEAKIILPTVKASRTDLSAEIVDIEVVFKNSRDLLNIELKLADAKKIGKKLQEDGAFGDNEELTVNGIKYKIKRSW